MPVTPAPEARPPAKAQAGRPAEAGECALLRPPGIQGTVRRVMTLKACRFAAFLFLALVLGAGLAHLFAMPGKMVLSPAAYVTVQQIYNGWDLSLAVVGAVASLGATAWLLRRRRPRALALTLLALAAVAADEVVVWNYAAAANRMTANWTVLPVNWPLLRAQWEYAHAAGAALDLVAFAAFVLSVLLAERPLRSRDPDESSGGRGAPLRFMAVR
jgi:hypothetical protein